MPKYLFKALFKSGEILEQSPDDQSATTKGKNCFYDVLQRLNEVRAFALYNQETGEEWLTDLEDGHFEHNQSPFFIHDEELTNKRLIFFKRNSFNALNGQPLSVTYHLGFQSNKMDGSNVQKVIMLT